MAKTTAKRRTVAIFAGPFCIPIQSCSMIRIVWVLVATMPWLLLLLSGPPLWPSSEHEAKSSWSWRTLDVSFGSVSMLNGVATFSGGSSCGGGAEDESSH